MEAEQMLHLSPQRVLGGPTPVESVKRTSRCETGDTPFSLGVSWVWHPALGVEPKCQMLTLWRGWPSALCGPCCDLETRRKKLFDCQKALYMVSMLPTIGTVRGKLLEVTHSWPYDSTGVGGPHPGFCMSVKGLEVAKKTVFSLFIQSGSPISVYLPTFKFYHVLTSPLRSCLALWPQGFPYTPATSTSTSPGRCSWDRSRSGPLHQFSGQASPPPGFVSQDSN